MLEGGLRAKTYPSENMGREIERRVFRMKKTLALFLTLVLLLTIGAGAALSEGGKFGEGVTIKIYTYPFYSSMKDLSEILPLFKMSEEETGVTLDWTVLTPDYNAAMSTMLAAGDIQADLIAVPGNASLSRYVEQGLFQALDQYITPDATPNMYEAYKKRSDVIARCVYNGEQYFLPNRFCWDNEGDAMAPVEWVTANMIRQDQLEAYGYEALPETIDELYAFLSAWKADNQDKYPWVPRYGIVGGNGTVMSLAGSWGIYIGNGDGGDFYPEGGTMTYQWTKPEMKEYLREMSKWYEEGLIDPAIITGSQQELAMTKIIGGEGIFCQGWATEIPAYGWHSTSDGGRIVPMQIPYGPNGDRVVVNSAASYMGGVSAIPSGSAIPDIVLKWMDHTLFSPQALIRLYYGIEGETYEMVNGEPELKAEFIAQDDWTSKLFDMGTQMYPLPIPFSAKYTAAYDKITYDANGIGYQWDMTITMKDTAQPPYYSPIATPAEEEILNEYSADLYTYRDEMIVKFILKQADLDTEWDSFVAQCDALGLQEILKVEQAKWDRMQG